MQVKKYVVDSMPEALKKIRKDLGNNAVIIDTKKIKTGGIFGFFGKQQIEVIAAIDNSKPETKVEKKAAPIKKEEALEPRISVPDPITINQKNPYQDMNIPSSTFQKGDDTQLITKQMQEMKELITKYIIKDDHSTGNVNPLVELLRKQGIEETVIQQLMKELLETSPSFDASSMDKESIKVVLKNMIVSRIAEGISPKTKLAHFIGPTGVGKTTTIAKIAAEQVLKYKRKVGFITSDTYRIAAVDQLRTYANILNVPLEVVYSPKDMAEALNKLSNCDLILMDTAGRNYRNEMYVNELKNLLSQIEANETYLVLSLASKYEDMAKIIENFNAVKIDKLIFTKLDETSTYGAVFNVLYQYNIPLSYMAYGQNVPDDISLAESEKLLESVLGERAYGS